MVIHLGVAAHEKVATSSASWALCPHWVTAANWKRRNNYCLKSDGGDIGDTGKYGTPTGTYKSQWESMGPWGIPPLSSSRHPKGSTSMGKHLFHIFFYDFMFTSTNLNFTHSQQTDTDTQQSWGTRTAIQVGWDVCMSADNKWRWIGGSGGVVWGTVGAPTVLISRFSIGSAA